MIGLLEIVLEKPKHLNTIDSYLNHMNQNRINIEYEIVLRLLKGNTYGREIVKELDISLTTIQRSMLELERKNILDVEIQGKNKMFSLKKNIMARNHIFNAENYKLVKLLSHYPELGPVISDVLVKSKSSLVILFGSFAKFSAKKGSDIDIYLDTSNIKEKKEVEMVNSKINAKIGKFDINSLLIKEIIRNHVVIKGVEEFYEKTRFFE